MADIDNYPQMKKTPLSVNLKANVDKLDKMFTDCNDIKNRRMKLGQKADIEACIYFVEVAVNNLTIEESVIGKLISRLMGMESGEIYEYLKANGLGITDVKELETLEDAVMGVMQGDGVFLIDGYDRALKIQSKGYPSMSVGEAPTEQVVRGSREGFSDSVKTNSALLRKRVRNNSLKIKEKILGKKTNTTVAIAYIEGLARDSVIRDIENRLSGIDVDGITDSGILEQLAEENRHSPFPQYQTTERPDKAALAVMTGRVVVMVDNTPVAILLPTTLNGFFKTADDYYNRHMVVTMARIIRFVAAILACSLPAMYLAVVNFHPEILPTPLAIAFASARKTVPFPAVVEVLLMELSFELLREAGVRVPGPMGDTIGIVGGLIVGQAAVEAGIVSPIIVIVVAITALSSFAVPNEELASAFRIIKYFFIFLAYISGFFGVVAGWLIVLAHLSEMKSFGFPYLMPYVADEINGGRDMKDSLYRSVDGNLNRKSIFLRPKARRKK